MKNLSLTIVLVLMTTTISAQENSTDFAKATVENDEIVAIESNVETADADSEYRYYYFPNMYAYYDLETKNYIYKINNKWETNSELPQYYGGYSLFKNARVPLKKYCGETPQENLKEHKKQYPYIKKSRMARTLYVDNKTALSNI